MPDAHIRFERMTEARTKSAETVEQLLGSMFTPYDVAILPNSSSEIKAGPPNAWTSNVEQIVMRSLSFSEYEMISQPIVLMMVVSTSDVDPVAAMMELASMHHTPSCLSNGQYDPTVQRVYVLLDDAGEKVREPFSVLRLLHSRFPPSCTKLISINSFSSANPNFQQPDMWSKFMIPKYFPELAPKADPDALHKDPVHNKPVVGCRLSVDDFMKLREFSIWLYNEQIIPALERRLITLGKQVNDSRRGVKNVLKSFWRKPRDETEWQKGSLKYRYDKIETQTLLLADTAFMIKDYETAASMYKLVRDDYRADKSNLHLSYTLLMIAACQIITEPHKYREVQANLESIAQCLAAGIDMPHGGAAIALLAAELYVTGSYGKAPLESARLLLLASQIVARYPLLSGLLIERAGLFMLQGFQVRRYVFHSILAGNKLHRCGPGPAKHAMACFAAALVILEKGNWGDMKTKLARALAADMKVDSTGGRRRSLILLLKVLASILESNSTDVATQNCSLDAVSVLNEIGRDGGWGNIRVNEGWSMCPARDVLLGPLPIGDLDADSGACSSDKPKTEVCGLPVPELDMDSLMVLEPVNGSDHTMLQRATSEMLRDVELLKDLLAAEREVCLQGHGVMTEHQEHVVARHLAKIQRDFNLRGHHNPHRHHHHHHHRAHKTLIPLGEKLFLKFRMKNKLPVDLALANVRLGVDRPEAFEICGRSASLPAEESIDMLLEAKPSVVGNFKVVNAQWDLSDCLVVKQALSVKGPLLQRTLKQRANRERSDDQRLHFEVVPAEPLLRLNFEGLSPEALQGQLIRSKLRIINEGGAVARDIFIKCNHPWFIFFHLSENGGLKPLDLFGCSNTVVHLAEIVINPGCDVQLDVWLRMSSAGPQQISLLAAYAEKPECRVRTSFLSVQVTNFL